MLLNDENRRILLRVARNSIENGFKTGYPLCVNVREYPPVLLRPAATFVSLEKNHQLRGCIGMLEGILPLVEDVAENAYSAAFSDPRFGPLQEHELPEIEISIHVLSEPELIEFSSEEELQNQLQPYVDGLILKEGPHHGTFLPHVWKTFGQKHEFLRQLKSKAGLPPEYWSDTVEAFRYTTEIIK